MYTGAAQWDEYNPDKVIGEGLRVIKLATEWIESQGGIWESRLAAEVIWSNYMDGDEIEEGMDEWQGPTGAGTAYTLHSNTQRLGPGWFELNAEGERIRNDGSSYRIMVLQVMCSGRRKVIAPKRKFMAKGWKAKSKGKRK